MIAKRIKYTTIFVVSLLLISCRKEQTKSVAFTTEMKVDLGRKLFFDKSLSNPGGQSCSSCHTQATGFSDPNHNIVSPGAVDGLFGNRNAPNIAYSMFSPALHYSIDDSAYMGGFFMDGRVNTLQEQAKQPFLNPLEMNNTNAAMVISKLQSSINYTYYRQVYGDITDVNTAFSNIADALSAFETSYELNPFTSKFDYYLKGQASLTEAELRGMQLFTDTLKGMCANCHLITPDAASGQILFTDHTYTNDGVPKNPNNPYYSIPASYNALGAGYIDLGLGDFIKDHSCDGEFKVPTLRNIAVSAPYFHNGCFNTLEQVVHFYNTRDVAGSAFGTPEVLANIDSAETGNLKLTAQEESDIVAFLKTLTDGYQ